jgi:hypoxanthine phosphoribosyltransferase
VRRRAVRVHCARDVGRALTRMAHDIGRDLGAANPVLLAVMRGGVYTAVELSRRLSFPHEFDYVHVTRYRNGTRGAEVEWRVRPSASLAGRSVLIVDDILDKGRTLAALQRALTKLGVSQQRTAVLIVKRLRRSIDRPAVDYSGLVVGDSYVFGCGMDYRGYWRNLPAIYSLPGGDG